MVDQDSTLFVISKWVVIVIGAILIFIGAVVILTSPGSARELESKSAYEGNRVTSEAWVFYLIVTGLMLISFGGLGMYGAIKHHFCTMLSFAIILSIILVPSIGFNLIAGLQNHYILGYVFFLVLLFTPLLICSWIVVVGIKSG